MLTMDRKRFDQAAAKILSREHENHGIGTLGEKTLHAVVKNYVEPDEDYHEVPLEGYVADVYRDGHVFEIQTANFNTMRGKLETFLPLYQVTIVYPVPATKWLRWIDVETGEVTATGLPSSNVLYFDLEDDAWLCVRPSGTEPKVKFYYGIKGTSLDDADAKSAALGQKVLDMINEML